MPREKRQWGYQGGRKETLRKGFHADLRWCPNPFLKEGVNEKAATRLI
jgi:hypothetical protein